MNRGIRVSQALPSRSRPRTGTLVVLLLLLPAAGLGASWSLRKPSNDTEVARAVASGNHEQSRTNAVVILLRDTRKTIAAIQAARAAGGESAAQAQAALDQIAELARR